jgi:Tfp pilus assembly protein FimV
MVAITSPSTLPPRLLPFARPARPPDVVYRRRRLLVLGAALVLAALVLAAVTSLQATASRFAGEPAATVTYVVEPGDTVWSIAESLAPDADPRPFVDEIVEANGSARLDVGQRLVLALP